MTKKNHHLSQNLKLNQIPFRQTSKCWKRTGLFIHIEWEMAMLIPVAHTAFVRYV